MAQTDRIHELLLALENPTSPGTRGQLLARALRTAAALVDADAAAVVLTSSRRPTERLVLHAGGDLPAVLPLGPEGSEALRALALEIRTILFPDLSEQPAYAEGDACPGVEAGPALFVPIARTDHEPGYLAVHRRRGRARFTPGETQSMLLLAAWLGAALERRRLAGRAPKADDGESASERTVRTALKKEIRRAHRHGQELSLILVAVDPPTDGGDESWPPNTLADVAELLGAHVRDIDLVGRCTEGRTAIVLPQTGRAGAVDVAARMRLALAAHAFAPQPAGAVTATFGVATFPGDGVDLETLWAVTERVVRDARQRGGNCVETPARRAA